MITIPKPCHEDWNQMTPEAKGRLCDKCCKVVVDFTKKTVNEIADFLNANTGQRICGRFKTEHVTIPVSAAPKRISRTRLFIAAVYFVFGGMLFASCSSRPHQEVMGGIAPESHFTIAKEDTVKRAGQKVKKETKKQLVVQPHNEIMGDVEYIPQDTAKTSEQPK